MKPSSNFTAVARGEDFSDAFDLFKDQKGRYCYMEICIPVPKVDANGVQQTVLQKLPRFGKTAIFGTAYFVQYTPFFTFDAEELFDSRIPADEPAYSIDHPVYDGPFQLGLSGPAIYFGAAADAEDDDGVIVQEEASELEEPIIA